MVNWFKESNQQEISLFSLFLLVELGFCLFKFLHSSTMWSAECQWWHKETARSQHRGRRQSPCSIPKINVFKLCLESPQLSSSHVLLCLVLQVHYFSLSALLIGSLLQLSCVVRWTSEMMACAKVVGDAVTGGYCSWWRKVYYGLEPFACLVCISMAVTPGLFAKIYCPSPVEEMEYRVDWVDLSHFREVSV